MREITELKMWLTEHLKEAEPLDSESTMADPQHVAVTATKKLALLGYGEGPLSTRAYQVADAKQCAAVLADCLRLLPKDEQPEPESDLLTVEQAAARLGNVSPRTVSREIEDGNLRCVRVRGSVRVPVDAITDYIECQQQQGKSLFR